MATKKTFNHYQPLGNSDPAHTATAPGGLSAKAPAMTPLMLDTTTRKLVVWDGTTDGAAVGILAVAADQTSTTLTFYKSGTFRYEDVLWPEAASDETKNGPRLPERQSASFNLPLHQQRPPVRLYGNFMSMYTTAQLLASTKHQFKFDPLFLRLFFREAIPSPRRKSISHKFRDW
ncbi:hypothetical protein ECZU29_63150 [Escherichia coli]|nr:hypothetical protein ECZU29_63150 [Escherichia coli]